MKLYDLSVPTPSARRAHIFIAEKGIDIEVVTLDFMKGEHRAPEFKALNPRCTVPTLELDDGTGLGDNLAIAWYLEEVHPEPRLMGTNAVEKAQLLAWDARINNDGLLPCMEAFRNSVPFMKDRSITGPVDYPQVPGLVARGRARITSFLQEMNEHLEGREFFLGDRFSYVDICVLSAVDFGGIAEVPIPDDHANLKRWYAAVNQRPSVKPKQ